MIYLVTFILLLFLAINYDFGSKKKFSQGWYNFVLLLFIAIAGLRFKVGGDTLAYHQYFESVKALGSTNFSELLTGRYAFLWNVFAAVCKTISTDFVVLQLLQTVFINLILFWFIKKYSKFRFTTLLIYSIHAYLYFNMEIMRESVAICFFLLAYPYFERKSWVRYYALCLIAFLFHVSAIIVFVFPLLRFLKFSFRNLIVIAIFFIAVVILLASSNDLINLLLITETIEGKFNYYSEYALNFNGKLLAFISFIVIPLYLIRINDKVQIKKRLLFENVFIIYFMIAISYVIFSGFSRFLNYMTPFMMIYFADVLNNIYNYSHFRKLKRLLVVSLFIITATPKYLYHNADMSRFYPGTVKFNLYYPYSSIFEKKEYSFRSIIFVENMRESATK